VLDPDVLRGLSETMGDRMVGFMAGPSCKGTSSATFAGKPSVEPVIIPELRDRLEATGRLYAMEQPQGSRRLMRSPTLLRGAWFGEHVDRPRLWETNFPLHVDACLLRGETHLRPRTCLGAGAKFKSFDSFGRLRARGCCGGNILAVHGGGENWAKGSAWASAMGLDRGSMTTDEVSQAIPPAYAQYVFGQMAMHDVHTRYGCPLITYDQVLAKPELRHELMAWAKGAGSAAADSAVPTRGGDSTEEPAEVEGRPPRDSVGGDAPLEPEGGEALPRAAKLSSAGWDVVDWGLQESDFREIEYSHMGDFDGSVIDEGAPDWLGSVREAPCWRRQVLGGELKGKNTYVHCKLGRLKKLLPILIAALAHRGTRITVVAPECPEAAWAKQLATAGFSALEGCGAWTAARSARGCDRTMTEPAFVRSAGSRLSAVRSRAFDYAAIEPFRDPRDTGEAVIDKSAKEALAYEQYPVPPHEAWSRAGAPESVVSYFRDGVRLRVDEEGPAGEVAQEYSATNGLVCRPPSHPFSSISLSSPSPSLKCDEI
jgi:hypothetical protein